MSTLIPALQRLARSLYFSAPNAPQRTREFLQDFARPENRYPMRALEHFVTASRCANRPADRLALAEEIRRLCLSGDVTDESFVVAADLELVTQYDADVVLRELERHPNCPIARARFIATHSAHEYRLRRLIDTAHRSWQ